MLNKILFSTLLCSCMLASAQNHNFIQVAYDDCGQPDNQPHLILGENYTMPAYTNTNEVIRTCNFGSKVIYAFDKMDIQASYRLEIAFLADQERQVQLIADGNTICEDILIPEGKEVRKIIDLPRHAFAYGQFVLVIVPQKGPNAIVSEIKLYSTNSREIKAVSNEAKIALKDTRTYQVNTQVDAEAKLPQYTPVPESVSGVYKNRISLNGVWEFKESESNEKWEPIQVPGQWNMQGFKVDSATFAHYRREFEIPTSWKNQEVVLRFDGVHSEYKVLINGKQVGQHMGGMTPYEVNITHAINSGKNKLELYVRSESLADMLGSLTQYAAHQLGGITRKVTLFAIPKVHISDLRIITDLDSLYQNASLKMKIAVTNKTGQTLKDIRLQAALQGTLLAATDTLPALQPDGMWKGEIEMHVERPDLWDPEHPNLYKLQIGLYTQDKQQELLTRNIGFREVRIQGNRMLLNGKPLKLRGVCRHESHPLLGRSLTDEQWRKDAELYRSANCNFIRTSHYPPAEEFINYCDQLGLLVEVEAPICWIGHHANENWQKLNYQDPKYYEYVLQANMETIHFYRNNPSVIFWSIANESYWNKEFAQIAEYVRKADPTRPYAFHDQAYGGFNNQGSTAPIANFHYPGPEGYQEAQKSKRPMTYGEYCHLNVYNRSELVTDPGIRSDWALALQPMWENMYHTDGVLGGSIWSGIDDIFQLPNGEAVGYGAWGPIDGWRRPKPEYWDMKKVYSPVKIFTKELNPSHLFILDAENRFTFTDFNELYIEWNYGNEKGRAQANLQPGKQGKIQINVQNPNAGKQLYLRFTDARGVIIDEYMIPVGEQIENKIPQLACKKTKLNTNKTAFVIKGDNFVCEISRTNGLIKHLIKNGKTILTGGPYLMVLPLTGGGCYPNHNANTPIFNDCCKNWKAEEVTAETVKEGVLIHVKGQYQDFHGSYKMLINANGKICINYDFTAKTDINPRQWGMVFASTNDFDETFWNRSGLWSVYPSDHISRPSGKALCYYPEVPQNQDPRTEPTWSWSKDYYQMGSNDFRATRRNIWFAGLTNSIDKTEILVVSDGQQHWRTWKDKQKTFFLIADFATAGDEMFLSSHYAPYRKPIKKDDIISGKIELRLK